MGALVGKPYSYKYRSWELSSYTSIDLTSILGLHITIQKQGNTLIRVLPNMNNVLNTQFISDTIRFSLDSEKYNRITSTMVRTTYLKNKSKEYFYLPTNQISILKNLLSTYFNKLHIICGKYIEMKTLITLKNSIKFFSLSNNTFFIPADFYNPNYDFNYDYSTTLNIMNFESRDAIFLIGSNIFLDEPLLAGYLSQGALVKEFPIYTLGTIKTTFLTISSLGNSIFSFINAMLAKNSIVNKWLTIKNPLLIVGTEFFGKTHLETKANLIRFLSTLIN